MTSTSPRTSSRSSLAGFEPTTPYALPLPSSLSRSSHFFSLPPLPLVFSSQTHLSLYPPLPAHPLPTSCPTRTRSGPVRTPPCWIPDPVRPPTLHSAHRSKPAFYAHTLSTLESLLDDEQSNWITALSNASSLLYHSFLSYPRSYGATDDQTPVVNWCGASRLPRPPPSNP